MAYVLLNTEFLITVPKEKFSFADGSFNGLNDSTVSPLFETCFNCKIFFHFNWYIFFSAISQSFFFFSSFYLEIVFSFLCFCMKMICCFISGAHVDETLLLCLLSTEIYSLKEFTAVEESRCCCLEQLKWAHLFKDSSFSSLSFRADENLIKPDFDVRWKVEMGNLSSSFL